jgi:uncharacterized repeat protein (TIGR03803 family)
VKIHHLSCTQRIRVVALVFAAFIAGVTATADSQTHKVLYNFKGAPDAENPSIGLVADPSGKLYGVTSSGGLHGWGAVFELTPPSAQGGEWTESVIYNFVGGNDSGGPAAGLILDHAGNLYGTTLSGGGSGHDGTVYELTPPDVPGSEWTETLIYRFAGSPDGEYPVASLVFDRAGNLYGTTVFGGKFSNGAVFRLAPPAAKGGEWTETVLYSFVGQGDGLDPQAGLILDSTGALYGTTWSQTVFKLTPPADHRSNWTLQSLYNFGGGDHRGSLSNGNLLAARNRSLIGTQQFGEGSSNAGTVFQLTPGTQGLPWTETLIHQFTGGSDGLYPLAGVISDRAGNFYGTTESGGTSTAGTVFKLTPSQSGAWTETSYSFRGGLDGSSPAAGVIFGKGGALYGTTAGGGSFGKGTVFQIVP